MTEWLHIERGDEPLVVGVPHAGTAIPASLAPRLVSEALARRDTDWWVDRLYGFAADLGATIVRTSISRTVIDVNRDPSGASLYPGRATTELCPTTTFDGEPLYLEGAAPDAAEIASRRAACFDPYQAALQQELERLKAIHGSVVLYDAHSIRSRIPRLFEGELPEMNIGANGGASCAPALAAAVEAASARSGRTHVLDGRFRGGWTTRRYGRPETGVHAIQMELACRSYMDEPADPSAWPSAYDEARAAPMRALLADILSTCIDFAKARA